MKRICGIINAIYNIVAVLYSVAIAIGVADAVAEKGIPFLSVFTIKPASKAACITETTSRVTAQGAFEVVNKFCKFTNCQYTPLLGNYQEWLAGKINELPGAKYLPQDQPQANEPKSQLQSGFARYLKIQDSIVLSTVFVCLPGIVYNLDKYRQIKCLYADCLQNAVGKEGLPVTACEDQKSYATCKYVTGEAFTVIPYTAVFDHFARLVKNTLSNPFAILGAGISLVCGWVCSLPSADAQLVAFKTCEGVRLINQIGLVASEFKNIIDEGFTIRQDYCSRLEDNDKSSSKSSKK